MGKRFVVSLIAALLCSACSSSVMQETSVGESIMPASQQMEVKLEEHSADDEIFHEGLAKEDWEILKAQREKYGAFSYEQLVDKQWSEGVRCFRLAHLEWEHGVPTALIPLVGQVRYEIWMTSQSIQHQCPDIYSFAKRFSISFEELKALLNEHDLTQYYDLNTLERRFRYFNGDYEEINEADAEVYYEGLEKADWEFLQKQKEWFEALSNEAKDGVLEGGGVGCTEFIHLYWEENHPMDIILYVGADQFENWIKVQQTTGQCTDIYSFAKYFSLDFNEFRKLITKNNLNDSYDLKTMERRFKYFNGE